MAMTKTLEQSLERLEPTRNYAWSLARLLLSEARRRYAKYSLMDSNFRGKYGLSFEEFAGSELMRKPSFEVEQDFFDWDMATTGMKDMREEIETLEKALSLSQQQAAS